MAIFHLAHQSDWIAARGSGEYRISSRGLQLDRVGFIHASTAEQLSGVAEHFYRDDPEELVVLVIDSDALAQSGIEVRCEDGGDGELFPHIYGSITPDVVTQTIRAYFDGEGSFRLEEPLA